MSSGFVAGTLVHTDKGLIPIQNLKVGNLVVSRNTLDGLQCFSPIEKVSRSDKEEIFALRFINNFIAPDLDDFFEPVMNLPNMKPSRINLQILSSNQKIWVDKNIEKDILQGWRSAYQMNGCEQFHLKDSKELGGIISVNSLCRTHIKDVFYVSSDGDYVSFVIDLRNEKIIIYFVAHLVLDVYNNEFHAEQHLPLAENIVIGDLEKHEILNEIIDLIRNNVKGDVVEMEVFNLEIKETHSYFVGYDGVLVGDAIL